MDVARSGANDDRTDYTDSHTKDALCNVAFLDSLFVAQGVQLVDRKDYF